MLAVLALPHAAGDELAAHDPAEEADEPAEDPGPDADVVLHVGGALVVAGGAVEDLGVVGHGAHWAAHGDGDDWDH